MLELSSNTIKVLGIFGRLSPEQEAFFDSLEQQVSQKPVGDEFSIFRHLTLTFIPNASVSDVKNQLQLLKDLKQFLTLKIRVKQTFVKDEESYPDAQHIAFEFDLSETKEIVDFVRQRCGDSAIATWYIKTLWFVPKDHQKVALHLLSDIKELEFTNFHLVANKQDEANTIFTSTDFGD